MFYKTQYLSPLGNLTLASDGTNLVGLWQERQKYFAATIKQQMHHNDTVPIFLKTKYWLDRYFAQKRPNITDLDLAPCGNEFRQTVWRILCEIPYGELITYKEIAQKVAHIQHKPSMSAQAIGGAVGHNPISIIIPCHRVIGTNGRLTGYAGGIQIKRKLLDLEGVDLSKIK